jgi:DnaJ family protein C protein 3
MHLPYWKLAAISAGILSSVPSVLAITAADIPNHTPVSQLLASADSHLSQGQTADALEYYDAAISRDPQNFLTYFKRGATYLSLGRTSQARSDFDKVLSIKPGFQGALLQRAKIYAGLGDWDAAKRDYEDAAHEGPELAGVKEAEEAAGKAVQAEASGDLEGCITQASAALLVANRNLALRQLRVGCRLARGEVQEAISDLLHVLQLQPGLTFPHMQISAMQFFALGDRERGLAQIRKCLHSDPDSKDCMKLLRREKVIEKDLTKAEKALEKKQFATALKYLVKNGEDAGLLEEIKTAIAEMKTNGVIPDKAPNEFYTYIAEMACQCSQEVCHSFHLKIATH